MGPQEQDVSMASQNAATTTIMAPSYPGKPNKEDHVSRVGVLPGVKHLSMYYAEREVNASKVGLLPGSPNY